MVQSGLDGSTEARIYSGLSLVHCHAGELDAAAELGEKALAISQQATDPRGEAQARSNLGIIMARRGDPESARRGGRLGMTRAACALQAG